MAEKIDALSLQSLFELIQSKADIEHTHIIAGEIESAVMLGGVHAKHYLRNDLGAQVINSYNDDTSLTIESEKSSVKLEAGRNQALLVVGDKNMSRHALKVTGTYAEDVHVDIQGELAVNGYNVLTVNDAGQVTGLDMNSLNLNGKGIIVSAQEPANPTDGLIWAKVVEDDIETEPVDDTGSLKVLSLPVGTIIDWLGTVVPTGFIPADGGLYSRSIYPKLWAHAKVKTQLLDDVTWMAKKQQNNPVENYSAGDRSTVFRVPFLPTGGTTVRIIKAYDEPSVQSMININALATSVDNAIASRAVAGVGYLKYATGELWQTGVTTIAGDALFAVPFIDSEYQVFPNLEGTQRLTAQVVAGSKSATKCNLAVYNDVGTRTYAKTGYLAFGRWK